MSALNDGRKVTVSLWLVALMIFAPFTGLTFFAENAQAGHSVTITSPSNGDSLGKGSVTVQWTLGGDQPVSPTCTFEFRTSDEGTFQEIPSNQIDSSSCGANGGSFTWTATGIEASDVTIRVKVANVAGTDEQSAIVGDLLIDNKAPVLEKLEVWSAADASNVVDPLPSNAAPSVRVGDYQIRATVRDGIDGILAHVSQAAAGAGVKGQFEIKAELNKRTTFSESSARQACNSLTAAAQGLQPATSTLRFQEPAPASQQDGKLFCFTLSWRDAAGNTGNVANGLAVVIDNNPRLEAGTASLSTPGGSFTESQLELPISHTDKPTVGAGPYTLTFSAYDHKWPSTTNPQVAVQTTSSTGPCPTPSNFRPAQVSSDGQIRAVTVEIPDNDPIFTSSTGTLCLTPRIQDAGGKGLVDADGSPVPTWTVKFNRTHPSFSLGSEATPTNRFALKANEVVKIRSADSNTFQDNVVLVVDPKVASGSSASLSKVQFEAAPWDFTNKRCGSFSLVAERDFSNGGFSEMTWVPGGGSTATKGVYCIRVSVLDSNNAKATLPPAGQPKRVAVGDESTNHKPKLSNIKADEAKGSLIFKQGGDPAEGVLAKDSTTGAPTDEGRFGLQLGGKADSRSAAFLRVTFKDGVVIEKELPVNGLWTDPQTGVTYDFWNANADVFFPALVLCEDRRSSTDCAVPQGEYGTVQVQIVDAFNRISDQASWDTRADPSSTQWGHLIVDTSVPTGSVTKPTPNPDTNTVSVVADQLFTSEVKAGDTPLGAYKAEPSQDIDVTLEVRNPDLTTALLFNVEGTTGTVQQTTMRYTGPRPAESGSQQPFEKRISIPATVAASNQQVVLVAYPVDPAGNTPLRPQDAIKSAIIQVGTIKPEVKLDHSKNPEVPAGAVTKDGVTLNTTNSPLACPTPSASTGTQTCSFKYTNDTRPTSTGYTPFVLTFTLTNKGTVPDTLKVFAELASGQPWPATVQVGSQNPTDASTSKTTTQSVTLSPGEFTTVRLVIQPPDSARGIDGQNFANWVLEVRSDRDTSKATRATVNAEMLKNTDFRRFIVDGGTASAEGNLSLSPGTSKLLKFRVKNVGNVRGTYNLGIQDLSSETEPKCVGSEATDPDLRKNIVVQYRSQGSRIFSVAVDPGQTREVDLFVKAERLAAPTQATPKACALTVDDPTSEDDNPLGPRDRILRITVPRDPRLDVFEDRPTHLSPSEQNAKTATRMVRPGTVVDIPVRFVNQGNADLDIRLTRSPDIQDWTWVNRQSSERIVLSTDGTSSPLPACQSSDFEEAEEACVQTLRLQVPASAVAEETRTFTFTAIDRTAGVAMNSMKVELRVGVPGAIEITQPSDQSLAGPGPTDTNLPFRATSKLTFFDTPTGTLHPVAPCSGEPITGITAQQSTSTGASFDPTVTVEKKPASWTLEGGTSGTITCPLGTGTAGDTVVYLRPGLRAPNVAFTGDKVIALALGYGENSNLVQASLQEPVNQLFRAGSGDGIILDVSSAAPGGGLPPDFGFLVYQGTEEDGFEDIGCFGPGGGTSPATDWTSCPVVTRYPSHDILAKPIPIDGTLRTPQKTTETDQERRTQTPQQPDGFVTTFRLSQENLKLGYNPAVFRVVDSGNPRTFAALDATASVDITAYTSDGWTRTLPSIEATNLGAGWFSADLFIPPMVSGNTEVTRLDIEVTVGGQSDGGRQISGDALIHYGTALTSVDVAHSEPQPDAVYKRTETTGSGTSQTVTTTWYLDVAAPFGQISRADWEIGQQRQTGNQEPSYTAGGRQPSSNVPNVQKDAGWGVFKNTTSEGPVYYLCKGCTHGATMPSGGNSAPFDASKPVFRLTPFENDQGTTTVTETQTWTGVDTTGSTKSRDAGVTLSALPGSLKSVTMGAQGVKLYVQDPATATGDKTDLVRLTSLTSPNIQAATYVEKAPGERFENPPELSDVKPAIALDGTGAGLTFGGSAAEMLGQGVFTGFLGGKFTIFAVASPSPVVGSGLQTVQIAAVQTSLATTDQPTFTADYRPLSGSLQVTPHAAPNRQPSATGNAQISLAKEDGTPWFIGQARLTAAGAEQRTWHLDVRTSDSGGSGTLTHYAFTVDGARSAPQGTTSLPAFIPLTEGDTGLDLTTGDDNRRLDHRSIPGFGLQFGNVTFDLVAVGSSGDLQRRSDLTELLVVDAHPPSLNVTVPKSVEIGQEVTVSVIATDPSGVSKVTATFDPASGSDVDVKLTKGAGDKWTGTFTPAAAGTGKLTVVATDTGGNAATETVDIDVGENQKPRIENAGVVVDGTQFVRPSGQATFKVTDASIADGTITVTKQASGGTAPTVEGPVDLENSAGDVQVSGLGNELALNSYTATVTLVNQTDDTSTEPLVVHTWLNVTAPGATTSTEAINGDTNDDGEISGDVTLDEEGTYTISIEATNGTHSWAYEFDIEAVDTSTGTGGGGGATALTPTLDCSGSTCTVTVPSGLSSDGASASFVVNATDATGRSNERSFPVTADGTPPTVSVTARSPRVDGAPVVVGPETPLRVTATDAGSGLKGSATLTAVQAGVEVGSASVDAGDSVRVSQLGLTDSGSFRVTVEAADRLNNTNSASKSFELDADGPDVGTVSFTKTASGLQARTTVTDSAGVSTVRLHHRVGTSGSFSPVTLQANNGNFAGTIQDLPDSGTLEYYVVATDAVNNEGTRGSQASPLNFNIGDAPVGENSPPVVTIEAPTEGTRVSGTIQVVYSTSDPDGDIVTVNTVRAAPASGQALTLEPADGVATFDTTQLPEGRAVITVEATDGEATGQAQVEVIVDNLPDAGSCDDRPLRTGKEVAVCFRLGPIEGLSRITVELIRNGDSLQSRTLDPAPTGIYRTTFDIKEQGTYALKITKTMEDGTTEETTSEPFQVQSFGDVVRPLGRFIAMLALGVVVIGLAAFAAFGRWN